MNYANLGVTVNELNDVNKSKIDKIERLHTYKVSVFFVEFLWSSLIIRHMLKEKLIVK